MSPRLYTLDRLRVLSALLRCVLHTLVPYMVTRTGMWPFKEKNESVLLPDVVVFNIHSFIMESFFFLAGYLAWHQWGKYGRRYFVKERGLRVGVPFLAGLLIMVPFVLFLFPMGASWEKGQIIWEPIKWLQESWQLMADNFYPTAHLWFLFYLLLYYFLLVIVGPLAGKFSKKGAMKFSFLPVLIVVWLGMVLCYQAQAEWIVKNPLHTKVEWPTFVYYALFFSLGIWASAHPSLDFLNVARKYRYWFLAGWVVLCFVAPALQLKMQPVAPWQWQPHHLLATSTASLQTLLGLAGFAGLLHYQQAPGKLGNWLVQSSYWVYFTHMPCVMLFQLLLLPLSLPLFLKFILALSLSLGCSFFTYKWFGKNLLDRLKVKRKTHAALS